MNASVPFLEHDQGTFLKFLTFKKSFWFRSILTQARLRAFCGHLRPFMVTCDQETTGQKPGYRMTLLKLVIQSDL